MHFLTDGWMLVELIMTGLILLFVVPWGLIRR